MEDLNVVDSINNAGTWLARNQELLLSYAVNIVAAIVILVIGMIVALSLIHISEPTRPRFGSRMPSSA